MKNIDLRSDTVTLPSSLMRQAIIDAPLGDDVFQEDPTINKLESKAASLLGKEAALLVPSGTMGNLVSILVHCPRGSEIIVGNRSHTFMYEAGGVSVFGGIHSRQLMNQDNGTIELGEIKSAIRDDNNIHYPKTAAIILENTHNMCFGSPLEIEYLNAVATIAAENNLKIHIDGARIFNAAVALNMNVNEVVKAADSVTFCLSKGLSAPVGSVVCGSFEFIYEARRIRKALGGGMRQAGIIAAAGLVSLDKMINQIKIDHENAQALAIGISQIECLSIELDKIKSNIIYFHSNHKRLTGNELVTSMAAHGIHFFELDTNRFRLVTHSGITSNDVDFVLKKFTDILTQ